MSLKPLLPSKLGPVAQVLGKGLILSLLLGGPLCPLLSQSSLGGQLEAEVWAALDPIPPNAVERTPYSVKDFLKDGFEEARRWFSGMIYGYHFSYEPLDLTRQVEEVMVLTPQSELKWGDPSLKFLDYRVVEKEGRIYLRFTYDLNNSQIVQMATGRRQNFKPAGGRGGVPDTFQFTDRWDALKAGLREGIRNYLRPREFNKPRKISGEIFLKKPPVISNSEGQIFANTSFFLQIQEVREYFHP